MAEQPDRRRRRSETCPSVAPVGACTLSHSAVSSILQPFAGQPDPAKGFVFSPCFRQNSVGRSHDDTHQATAGGKIQHPRNPAGPRHWRPGPGGCPYRGRPAPAKTLRDGLDRLLCRGDPRAGGNGSSPNIEASIAQTSSFATADPVTCWHRSRSTSSNCRTCFIAGDDYYTNLVQEKGLASELLPGGHDARRAGVSQRSSAEGSPPWTSCSRAISV